MKIKVFDIVFLIFLFVFVFRLFFALQTMQFSDNESHYAIRQIENIVKTGGHIRYDELSYGGRDVLGIPLAFYIIALFEAIFGTYALKIVPALFMALLIFVIFLIAKKITDNNIAACFSALCSGFIPILVFKTLNNISPYVVVYPVFFLLLYSFYMIENKSYLILFIILTFLLPLLHPISFLLAISFIVYYILDYVEGIETSGIKKDAMLLFILVTFLLEFMIYRKAFNGIGLYVIWQNIPHIVLSNFFKGINVFDIMINIGIVPLVFGIVGIYLALRNKNKEVLVLMSICIASIALLIMKLVDFSTGLMLLGVTLSIIAVVGFDKFLKYIEITKLSKHMGVVKLSLFIFIILSLIVPSIIGANDIINNTKTEEDIEPFIWINNKTALSATIFADLDEGNLVTGIAKRKSVIDTNFMFVKDIDKMYEESESLFTLESEVKALEIITRYDIDYIYLSEKTKKKYDIDRLKFVLDESCFERVFRNEAGEIIKIIC